MERKDRESEQVRVKCAEKRTAMGYKITRHLTLSEGKEFLASGLYPASGLAPSTFKQAKELTALPPGATCMCCGHDLTGQPGWVVEIAAPIAPMYKTICAADYETVMSGKSGASAQETAQGAAQESAQPVQESAQESPSAPASAAVAPSTSAPENSVEAALQTLASALAAKSAPPPTPSIDKAEIVAEAVKAAKEEAKGFMQKSIADFIRDGGAATATGDGGEPVEEAGSVPASATGDGVEAAANASSWSAKATPKAVDAVEKLNKFLSEFSYFRAGVSMRLVNTFARAYDKAGALRSYCEVSQMEDLSDLVEKMKSPEFEAVCNAFATLDKTPQPLNKRFAVFYGAPGGGKTYAAIKAGESINGGSCDVVPCSPSMDAADMLYAYRLDYKSGRRGYVPTALLTAMVAGRAVILDEINLLPMEARMFLQDILDNKGKVHLMGVEIPIREGFFVIGTMNLETGLGATPLPLPLVDRASVVREFRTTTAQAAVGAGLC